MTRTILLVDQHQVSVDMLARRLQRHAYNVITACDGAEGVAQALVHLPDLILMDLELPIISGLDAVQLIRRSPTLAHVPIIVLVDHIDDAVYERARAAGGDEVDCKPIELPRLIDKMQALLGSPGMLYDV